MSDPARSIGDEFEPRDRADWIALAEATLRGRRLTSLVQRRSDGLELEPVYFASDAMATALARLDRSRTRGWDVRQVHDRPDPAAANRDILADLEGAVSSIELRFDEAVRRGGRPGRGGLPRPQ